MYSQSYTTLATEALRRISGSDEKFTQYTQWHDDGIVRVSLATQLSVEDLGNPAAQLTGVKLQDFQTARAVAKTIVDSRDDHVELRVAFTIIDAVCETKTSWIDELELYKQALITEIERSGDYTSIPCAQNSVVSAMRALWALVLTVRFLRIHPCGATPYTVRV